MIKFIFFGVCNFLNKDVRLDDKLMKELVMCGLVTYFGAREVKDNYFPHRGCQKTEQLLESIEYV